MAFNGSGTFVRLYNWVTDAANGIFVRADRSDAELDGIATGLSTCLTKDGQTTPTANIPLGGFKITGLGLGTGNTDAAAVQNVNDLNMVCGRLTLTTGLAVTTADVTAATTLYYTPFRGNMIALYDGTNWNRRTFAELSIDVTALAATTVYDVFAYDNAGTVTLETLAWTNDTTRATALTTQNSVLVKTGALTRRYIGSFRTNASTRAYDSYLNRWVWNYYNRVQRPMRATEATDTWAYTLATFRQANASILNQLDFVVGVAEDAVWAKVHVFGLNTNANVAMTPAIGLDSTTTLATGCLCFSGVSQVANQLFMMSAEYTTIPAAGRHTLVWLEFSAATGTSTWYGDGGAAATSQSGIHGWVWG